MKILVVDIVNCRKQLTIKVNLTDEKTYTWCNDFSSYCKMYLIAYGTD